MPKSARLRLVATIATTILTALALSPLAYALAAANQESMAEHSDVLMKVIAGLLSVNALFLTGFVAWLMGNQKELFARMGNAETKIETIRAVCEERRDKGQS